jgi:hypothetical protein
MTGTSLGIAADSNEHLVPNDSRACASEIRPALASVLSREHPATEALGSRLRRTGKTRHDVVIVRGPE